MRLERVLIYLPYGVIITDYFVSYYTAQNSVQQAVSVAALIHVRALHGMPLFRPSNNSDRRFRFFKTTSHAIALPCLFCYQPAKITCEPLSRKYKGITNVRVPFLFQGCRSRNKH